jgi:hypothetical protein
MLDGVTNDPRAYLGVAIMGAQQFVNLHNDALGRPSAELCEHAQLLLDSLQQREELDPIYLGMLVEGFAWASTAAGIEGDAVAGFKVRAGGRKGVAVAAVDKPDSPSDQNLYAAFVKARTRCGSDREAHLAVAEQFALPMPPSDAGRKRVMRAVKKLCPK